jgi:hypothetical protein
MVDREGSRPRSVRALVFGIEGRIASSVYGTVLVMATLAAASGEEPHPWPLAVLVSSTVCAVWIAHLYAHALSESIERRKRVAVADVKRIAHRELGILLAATFPVTALLLGAAGVFKERTAIWVAFGIGFGVLAVQGLRYARVEGLGLPGTAAIVAANLALGLVVVGFKVVIFH